METKIKWLRSDEFSPALIKKLASVITENPFGPKSDRGFLLANMRAGAVTAKFVERITGKRALTDPFGNRVELPYLTYEVVQFRFGSERPHIELLNAPRFPKKLAFFLTELTGDSFAVAPLQVDVRRWAAAISRTLGKITVSDVQFDDVSITTSLAADVHFFGSGNVVDDGTTFLGKRATVISKLRGIAEISGRQVTIELSATGAVRANAELARETVDALRITIPSQ